MLNGVTLGIVFVFALCFVWGSRVGYHVGGDGEDGVEVGYAVGIASYLATQNLHLYPATIDNLPFISGTWIVMTYEAGSKLWWLVLTSIWEYVKVMEIKISK